jgi:hypothetical protein
MASARTFGLGLIGTAVTLLARKATRRAMHDASGAPRLPAHRSDSITTLLIVAAASGALLALGEMLQEHRRQLSDASAR